VDLALGRVVPPPGLVTGVEGKLDVGVGGQAVDFGLVHVVNPVRCGFLAGCFLVDRDAALGGAVGVAGLAVAELGVGARFQAQQLGPLAWRGRLYRAVRTMPRLSS
jgi:hypothetical protein